MSGYSARGSLTLTALEKSAPGLGVGMGRELGVPA